MLCLLLFLCGLGMASKNINKYINTDYLQSVFYPKTFNYKINILYKKLKKFVKINKIDAIAFTGMSGAAFAFPLSLKLKIPLLCIRKKIDKSHSHLKVEGFIYSKNFIIIDDFIDTGNTINYIVKSINEINHEAECKGIFLYDYNSCCSYNKGNTFVTKQNKKIKLY